MDLRNKREKQIEKMLDGGNTGLIKYVFELEDKVDEELEVIQDVIERIKGKDGHTPTKEELEELIMPLIPEPLKGNAGDNYVLTQEDKEDIARSIEVPVVEKVVEKITEKVEVIKEQPIVTEITKEVAIYETAEDTRNKLEALFGDERLKIDAIQDLRPTLEELKVQSTNKINTGFKAFRNLTDTPLSYSGQSGKTVKVKTDETGLEFITVAAPSTPSLQAVTDVGATTDNIITVAGLDVGDTTGIPEDGISYFVDTDVVITGTGSITSPALITTGGTASQFVKGNGSLDSTTYLSSVPTLQQVTDIGATTTVSTTFSGGILTDSIFSVAGNTISFGSNGDHSIATNSMKDASGNVLVDVFNKSLYSSGIEVLNWGSGTLSDSGYNRISWLGMTLSRGNNVPVFNWDLGLLYWNNGVQHAVTDLSTQRLYDISDQTSIDWGARLAYASNGSTVIMNYNNSTGARFGASIQVGRTDTAPVTAIHVDKGNAKASALKFTAGTTTGLTATDGFDIGITTTGIAEIRQRENLDMAFYTNNIERMIILAGGNVGIGVTPTSRLHLPAGTATANTAPLKFISGIHLTTPEDGAIEYNGTHLYATIGSTRYQLDQQTGGGGGVSGQATVNFGAITQEDSNATVTVLAASVTSTSEIFITPAGIATADHDPDDYAWDNITGYVTNIVNGVSFDIIGVSGNRTWGRYVFNYLIN